MRESEKSKVALMIMRTLDQKTQEEEQIYNGGKK